MLKASAQTAERTGISLRIGVVLGLVLPLAFSVVRSIAGDRNPILSGAELWILDDVTVFLALATPALLAVLAARRAPVLFIAAGVLSTLIGLSPIVYTLPLIVPGIFYLMAYPRLRTGAGIGVRGVATLIVVVVLGLCPLTILFLFHETVCWSYRTFDDNTTIFSRDLDAERSSSDGHFSQTSGPPRPRETESGGGCTDGAVGPGQSMAMIAFAGGSLLAGSTLGRDE